MVLHRTNFGKLFSGEETDCLSLHSERNFTLLDEYGIDRRRACGYCRRSNIAGRPLLNDANRNANSDGLSQVKSKNLEQIIKNRRYIDFCSGEKYYRRKMLKI